MSSSASKRVTAFLDQAEFLGGAEYFLLDFFTALSPQDIRRLNPLIIGGKSEKYTTKLPDGFKVIGFDYPSVGGSPIVKILAVIKLFFVALKLKKILKQNQVTQVFTNTPRTHFIMWFVSVLGYKGKWSIMFHDFTTRPAKLVNLISKRADILIANSLPTRNWLRSTIDKTQHHKIKIVENGINFRQLPSPKPATEITQVLNLGRIDPQKGQKHFIEAADLLLERNPDLSFTLIGSPVKGNTKTEIYAQEIEAFIDQRKLKNVQVLPHTDDALATINQYDLVVFTPAEPETFGRVIIEALALGKMVISFDQTGPKEILHTFLQTYPETKNSAFSPLVETANSMSLAETIGYYADNPEKIKPFTINGTAFVENHFNLDETKKRLFETLL